MCVFTHLDIIISHLKTDKENTRFFSKVFSLYRFSYQINKTKKKNISKKKSIGGNLYARILLL